jgi:zinc protease
MKRFIFTLIVIITASMRPAFAADKILDVQKITTPAGIEIWLVQDKTVPVISMSYSFDGGLAYDPEGKPGVGRLVSILLDEGAGDMMSQEFQTALNDKAIDMSFTAGRDAFYGHLRTLRANKDAAFRLLSLSLNSPRFDKEPIERMRNANIAEIKVDMGNPQWLVARTFNGMVFEGHPYALPALGTLVSMSKITRQDLLNFIHAQFARDVLKVAIAGDISRDEAVKAVDGIFATLPAQADKTVGDDADFQYAGKTVMLPLNTPQTYISAGAPGLKRTDKDWQAATVMNFILGEDSFGSRLMEELRKKRGLTYGVTSGLISMQHAGLLQVNFSASNGNVVEALKILQQEWTKLAAEGPTETEVLDAKNYLTGSLPLELTSTGSIARALNGMQRDGLDHDYINRLSDEVNAVTVADVKRMAARLLKTEGLTTVLVGQPQGMTVDILLDHAPGTAVPQAK